MEMEGGGVKNGSLRRISQDCLLHVVRRYDDYISQRLIRLVSIVSSLGKLHWILFGLSL